MRKIYLLLLLAVVLLFQQMNAQLAPLVTVGGEGLTDNFSFAQPVAIDPMYNIKGVATGDFDGDGKPDIVAINRSTSVIAVYKNTSSMEEITFAPKNDLAAGGVPVELITGDVDNDGKPDIIIKIVQPNKIVVLRNTSSNGIISFANRVEFTAITFESSSSYYGRTMATKDIDGDGMPEIVSANSINKTFSVFRNTGFAGVVSFAAPADVPCDTNPSAIVIDDFDGDNKADITVLSSGNFFSVFRNTSSVGNISFMPRVDAIASSTIVSLIAGDYDDDGKPDLAAVTIVTRQLTIYRNTSSSGTISFAPRIEQALAHYPLYIDHGDFDSDGKEDWLVLNKSHETSFSISRNISTNGAIGSTFQQDFTADYWPAQSVVTDLNGDDKPDILTIEYNGYGLYFIRNTLHEPFIQSFSPAIGKRGDSITIKGWNFTGALSVQFGGVAASSFAIENDSTIKAIVDIGATGEVTVVNTNGTAKKTGFFFSHMPVITSISPASGPTGTVVTISGKNFSPVSSENIVYFGSGKASVTNATDSTLTVTAPVTATYLPVTVTCNGITGFSELPFILTFAGGGHINYQSFVTDTFYFTVGRPRHVSIADLDNDGKSDLAIVNVNRSYVSIFRNRGIPDSTAFGQKIDYPGSGTSSCMALGDLDGDGKKDMIIGSSDNPDLFVYRNITQDNWITFASRQSFNAGSAPSSVTVCDLNGDGRSEIVTTNNFQNRIAILLNNGSIGNISFSEKIELMTDFQPMVITVRDINGDSKPDLIAGGLSGYIYLFINNSFANNISFSDRINRYVGGRIRALAVGDIDGDVKPDIVVGGDSSNSVSIIRNISDSGQVIMAPNLNLPVYGWVSSIDLGDLNGDAKPDIAVTLGNKELTVFQNASIIGNISYQEADTFAIGDTLYYAAIGDLDGDGKPDMVSVDNSGHKFVIVKNRMAQALVIPSGSNPVTGGMTNKVTIDSTVQTYQGHPYVQRHYDITPVNNPATATATITLYFTQQEFDNYNGHPAHGFDLPHHADDNFNKANLRVYQYHGFSTTSLPGSYSGNGVEIDPDDTKIVWNTTTLQWEVTFEVNGFSGFFLSTAGNSMLPVTLLSLTGEARDKVARLQWTTTRELNVTHFEVQRRDPTSDFVTIGKIGAAGGSSLEYDYHYNDELGTFPVYYYRLKIVDKDQSVTYSKTIIVKPVVGHSLLTLGPNPAIDYVMVKHPTRSNAAQIRITGLSGKVIKTVITGNNTTQTRVGLKGLARGTYSIVWEDGGSSLSQVLIVQ